MASQGDSVNTQTIASAVSNATQNLIQALQYKGIRDPQLLNQLEEFITATSMYGQHIDPKSLADYLGKVSSAIKNVGNNEQIQQTLRAESTGTTILSDAVTGLIQSTQNVIKQITTVSPPESDATPYIYQASSYADPSDLDRVVNELPASTGTALVLDLPSAIYKAIKTNLNGTMSNISTAIEKIKDELNLLNEVPLSALDRKSVV